ncbi:MAG: SDR family oxidoreductase [Ferrovum myxofaciens]|uniref:SDR family oxidoreductase n=1 Tax=Ferrovum myxofaciens TaxID=416213 RepID=UPI002353652A|nr:SDR family oxidoreductase [Ferrovum myxofaciens]QKE42003.1 MAG: SDR family oxidoreductase [Ferrovum myxofaciens]
MELKGKKVLLTGATGSIGKPLAQALARQGATLIVTDHSAHGLNELAVELRRTGGTVLPIPADLLIPQEVKQLADRVTSQTEGIDILINLAGMTSFNLFHQETETGIENLWRLNTLAPMQLTRLLLPHLLTQGSGLIVNIGSIYGSIGFPGFSAYSASKFALRGFSEALRRELDGTGVGVAYVAPRYVTPLIHTGAIHRMSKALKVPMDTPEQVAQKIIHAVTRNRHEYFIGFPESLIARINGIHPALVDGYVRKQLSVIRDFALGKR